MAQIVWTNHESEANVVLGTVDSVLWFRVEPGPWGVTKLFTQIPARVDQPGYYSDTNAAQVAAQDILDKFLALVVAGE